MTRLELGRSQNEPSWHRSGFLKYTCQNPAASKNAVTPRKYGLKGSSADNCPIQAPDTPKLIKTNGMIQHEEASKAPIILPVAKRPRCLSGSLNGGVKSVTIGCIFLADSFS